MPQQFFVKIDSTPPNARIHIKELDLNCVTPCNDLRLPSGRYEVDAKLDGYQSSAQPVQVTDQTPSVRFTLSPIVAAEPSHPAVPLVSLVIQTHIADAIVFVGASQYRASRDGTVVAQVPPNSTYTIRVQKDRYKSVEKSVRVGEKNIQLPLHLEALPEAAKVNPTEKSAPEVSPPVPEPIKPVDTAEAEWGKVSAGKDRAGLQSFLERHPTSPHAEEARLAIDQLDWESASSSNNRSKLQDYLNKHPDGRFVPQCRNALDTLDWNDVKNSSDPVKLQEFLDSHPQSQHKTEAEAKIAGLRVKPTPPSHGSDDVHSIEKVLDTYVAAYQDMNKLRLRRVWPGLDDKKFDRIKESFKDAEKIEMTRKEKSPPVINGTGTAAQVVCAITTTVTVHGSKQLISKTMTFTLTKDERDGEWSISEIK